MPSSRRVFLQQSVAATAAFTVGPDVTPRRDAGHAVASPLERTTAARSITPDRVRITGGPLLRAQQADITYLLALDPDRMMAFYRIRAGLTPKAKPYGGWDGAGRNLTGHIAGHHLSAVSLMYRATDDARFKARADYLVHELQEVQAHHPDGYLGALEGGQEAFAALSRGEIKSGGFDLNGLWSPWYVLHKTFAGLRDAYRYTGNRTALQAEIRFAGWADATLAPLDDEQMQRMLNTEHGGMNEVLADLYADTRDARWLALSRRFEHRAFTDALKRHQDNLAGKHGNCQIPKLIGSAVRYRHAGDPADLLAAAFFWDRVTQHHTYATGGNGQSEYFGPPDQLGARVDGRTCESCNDYNMLKLTRQLFAIRPDAFIADFHERALFNHVLASFDPDGVRMSYMVPVGRGVQQEYQAMFEDFTCCVGTGMENHALHADGIYFESADTVWVNLFVPSVARLELARATLTQETTFPEGDSATVTVTLPAPREFTIAVRRPTWAGDAFTVRVNGADLPQPPLAALRAGAAGGRVTADHHIGLEPSSYVTIKRAWRNGDRIELAIPKTVRLEVTPDKPQVAAVMWGPLVLAGDFGPRREGRADAAPIPVLVGGDRPVTEWIKPDSAQAGAFLAAGVARVPATPDTAGDVTLTPFYRTHGRRYSVYFDVLTPAEFSARIAAAPAGR